MYPYGVAPYSASPPPTGMLPYKMLRERKGRKAKLVASHDKLGEEEPGAQCMKRY